MKSFLHLLSAGFIITCFQQPVLATTPLDDFSDPVISDERWYGSHTRINDLEGVNVVRKVEAGHLISEMSGVVNRADKGGSNRLRNSLWMANANNFNTISVKVTLLEAVVQDGVSQVAARLAGYFYDDANGYVWAEINLYYDGTNYNFYHGIYLQNGDWIPGTSLPVVAALNTEYTLKVEYDGSNQFTFWVNNESEVMSGPARDGESSQEYKGITTKIYGDGSNYGSGLVSATFDDFMTDGNLYDDFSSSLTSAKWDFGEVVRDVTNGQLQMNVQNVDVDEEKVELNLDSSYHTDYLQADVTITSDSILTGPDTWGEARIIGNCYNDTYNGTGYDGPTGETFGSVSLQDEQGSNLTAKALIQRCDNNDCSTKSTVWEHTFPQGSTCSIQYDQPATLSFYKQTNIFVFGCNEERVRYTNTGNNYPSKGTYAWLRTRVFSEAGQSGYLKTTYDNIYTKKPFSWNLMLPAILSKK